MLYGSLEFLKEASMLLKGMPELSSLRYEPSTQSGLFHFNMVYCKILLGNRKKIGILTLKMFDVTQLPHAIQQNLR